ncbi:hypothetical protein LMG28688_03712 [Paraburkholderia caffeinitolerans]|uniref:Uncharacterized protein n=1 Tax=Paraburkholderia caffeinitolerans TaxID=1723730 RepID=A0A6J5G4V7_9BURK|nr:hypothetical protein LMG28688_03712 [Paraburkholderia caffeinitolerans]
MITDRKHWAASFLSRLRFAAPTGHEAWPASAPRPSDAITLGATLMSPVDILTSSLTMCAVCRREEPQQRVGG